MKEICGAKTRSGGACKKPCGYGTDHVGKGKCKFHGGCLKGAPKGNKRSVKTGEYQSLVVSRFTERQKKDWRSIQVSSSLNNIENEIKLLEMREAWMVDRINQLEAVESGMTMVTEKNKTDDEGWSVERENRGVLGQILSVEKALTRIQAQKARCIQIRESIILAQTTGDDDHEAVKLFNASLGPMTEEIWCNNGPDAPEEAE